MRLQGFVEGLRPQIRLRMWIPLRFRIRSCCTYQFKVAFLYFGSLSGCLMVQLERWKFSVEVVFVAVVVPRMHCAPCKAYLGVSRKRYKAADKFTGDLSHRVGHVIDCCLDDAAVVRCLQDY